mgnify:CR=1 FL=1
MKAMRLLTVLILGTLFGIVLTKAEVISWYRIYEMFRFKSFHMYGVIGSAVFLGAAFYLLARKTALKTLKGSILEIPKKQKGFTRYILGGTLFGLGWALTGACPGPLYILVGNGFLVFLVAIASAMLGTFVYGLLRDKLPH